MMTDERRAKIGKRLAGHRVDARDVQRLVQAEPRQNRRQRAGHPCTCTHGQVSTSCPRRASQSSNSCVRRPPRPPVPSCSALDPDIYTKWPSLRPALQLLRRKRDGRCHVAGLDDRVGVGRRHGQRQVTIGHPPRPAADRRCSGSGQPRSIRSGRRCPEPRTVPPFGPGRCCPRCPGSSGICRPPGA